MMGDDMTYIFACYSLNPYCIVKSVVYCGLKLQHLDSRSAGGGASRASSPSRGADGRHG